MAKKTALNLSCVSFMYTIYGKRIRGKGRNVEWGDRIEKGREMERKNREGERGGEENESGERGRKKRREKKNRRTEGR